MMSTSRCLSHVARLSVMLPVLLGACRKQDGTILDVDMNVGLDDFNRVLAPYEKRVRDLLRKFMEAESLQPDHFSEVLMVGGTSAVPAFQELLRELFEADGQKRVRLSRGPMEAVAKGMELGMLDRKVMELIADAAGNYPMNERQTISNRRSMDAAHIRRLVLEKIRESMLQATGGI